MDDRSYTIRIRKKWARTALVVVATALIVAPLTAVATNAFTDVPGSNVHHDNITWLKDAAVTLGCNPPANDRYCPDDRVTRAQMATFMRRLAENQVVDAGMLEGKDSTQVMSRVWASNDSTFTGNTVTVSAANRLEINSLTIDAPADGFLIISGHVFINPTTNTRYRIHPLLDGNAIPPSSLMAQFEADGGRHFTMAYTITIGVTAGSHTVSQLVGPETGSADFFYNREYLTVQWVPAGDVQTSLAPAGVTPSDSETG